MYSAKEIRRMMRVNKCTIRALKLRTGITLKSIRRVRENGPVDTFQAIDFAEAIRGSRGLTPRERACLRQTVRFNGEDSCAKMYGMELAQWIRPNQGNNQ